MTLTNVAGAVVMDNQGSGTIENDDTAILTVNDVSGYEGDSGSTVFTFTVLSSRAAPPQGIRFNIATAEGTAKADIPATEGSDFISRALSDQVIPATQTTYTFEVEIEGDTLVEADENFVVNLTDVTGATALDSQGVGTILNDDAATAVISQVYGGGGNAGASYRNDFIEVFNRGATTIDLSGWSVQYTSATGTTWQVTPLCSSGPCLLRPATYFLVQEASAGGNGETLPAPDATGTIPMAATAGKVALVNSLNALHGNDCVFGPEVIDVIGYGTSADCFEGSARAPAPSATTADVRRGGGCLDSNNNGNDFFAVAPHPRNAGYPANICNGQKADLTIEDVIVAEGDSGTVAAVFTVVMHGSTNSTVTLDYSTANGTAHAGSDLEEVPPTPLVFHPGETSKTITINVMGDTLDEPNENFFVNLTNASNAAILDNQAQATIIDNDVPPTLSIDDISSSEGNNGITMFAFTVHLSAPALAGGVSFDIGTADGIAQDDNPDSEDNDYIARRIVGQIPAGSQDFIFEVLVNADVHIEDNETFFVNISNVVGATVGDAEGRATIQNDDSPAISIDNVNVNEGNAGESIFTFTVTSSLPAPVGGISFDIATADGTAQDDNPVSEDNDYVARSLTGQVIAEGTTTYSFSVKVNGDTKNEAACETFFVNLSNATKATIIDSQGQAGILDEDGTKLVISQIYGGGGNSGAFYRNDFIEIFNRGNTPINLSGMSVQYASATGTSWSVTSLTNVILQPGQYYLIQEGGAASGFNPLPSPDATGTIVMAATAGKVALVNGTAQLTGACPSASSIIDLVGFGTTASCREGASTADNAPALRTPTPFNEDSAVVRTSTLTSLTSLLRPRRHATQQARLLRVVAPTASRLPYCSHCWIQI